LNLSLSKSKSIFDLQKAFAPPRLFAAAAALAAAASPRFTARFTMAEQIYDLWIYLWHNLARKPKHLWSHMHLTRTVPEASGKSLLEVLLQDECMVEINLVVWFASQTLVFLLGLSAKDQWSLAPTH
jgi:hypothetical protein